jgi:hypothetical protein
VTATDTVMFDFLDKVSPISDCSDQQLGDLQAYYYQSYSELGFPDYSVPYLTPYVRFSEVDYVGELPTEEPTFDSQPMHDVLNYVDTQGSHLLFIYGQWDPWIEGRFVLGDAIDSESFVQPEGTHAAMIGKLKAANRETSWAMIESWTGVTPKTWLRRAGSADADAPLPRMPPVPPVLLHATVARR